MYYLYHFVPKNMQGNVLYPLNQLKDIYPEAYAEQVKKYVGRERMLDARIPILDCLWNDVIHLSAVNPKEIKQALLDAGGNLAPEYSSYYQIDPSLLDPKNTIVWLYTSKFAWSTAQDFESYNPETITKYSVLPDKTKAYYKEKIAKGERLLLHHDIPHILYKGTLDVTNIPVLTL